MKLLNKKGQVFFYIIFFILAIIIILIGAVFSSFGVLFNTKMYEAGEDILLDANDTLQDINDATVKGQIQTSIDSAFDAQQNNIEVNTSLFEYSWVFMLLIVFLVMFLLTRQTVEFGRGIS